MFFSSMVSVSYFLIFSISLLNFSLCSCIVLLTLVSIFMTIILNFLSGKSCYSISLGSVSGDLFLWWSHISLFLCMSISVMLKFGHLKKQPPFPVFSQYIYTEKDLYYSTQVDTLATSQTFSRDAFSLRLFV